MEHIRQLAIAHVGPCRLFFWINLWTKRAQPLIKRSSTRWKSEGHASSSPSLIRALMNNPAFTRRGDPNHPTQVHGKSTQTRCSRANLASNFVAFSHATCQVPSMYNRTETREVGICLGRVIIAAQSGRFKTQISYEQQNAIIRIPRYR